MNWPEKLNIRSVYLAPPSVTVSLCGSCNGQCLYCNIRNRPMALMPPDKAERLFKELSRHGTLRVGFTQDEPLLHPELGEILRAASRRFRFLTLGSNGILVPERIDELRQGSLDALILPLDGPAEIQDAHRGAGAFDAVQKASEAARRYGINLWFTCVLAADNLDRIDETLRLVKEFGGKMHVQPLYHAPCVAGDTSIFVPDNLQISKTLEKLLRYKAVGEPILNSSESLKVLLAWPDFARTRLSGDESARVRLPRCRGGRLFAHISSDGNLYPCTEEVGDGPNVFELGLAEALRRLRTSGDVCKFACSGSDYLEYNLLASPRLGAWLNLFEIWTNTLLKK